MSLVGRAHGSRSPGTSGRWQRRFGRVAARSSGCPPPAPRRGGRRNLPHRGARLVSSRDPRRVALAPPRVRGVRRPCIRGWCHHRGWRWQDHLCLLRLRVHVRWRRAGAFAPDGATLPGTGDSARPAARAVRRGTSDSRRGGPRPITVAPIPTPRAKARRGAAERQHPASEDHQSWPPRNPAGPPCRQYEQHEYDDRRDCGRPGQHGTQGQLLGRIRYPGRSAQRELTSQGQVKEIGDQQTGQARPKHAEHQTGGAQPARAPPGEVRLLIIRAHAVFAAFA